MLNKEIFIKRNIDPPYYSVWTEIASFTLLTQISQLQFVMRLTVRPCSIYLLTLFLSLCFLPLRHQVVWDRYMGVIKSCIFKMYHDWSVFFNPPPPLSPLSPWFVFCLFPPAEAVILALWFVLSLFRFVSGDEFCFSSPIIAFQPPRLHPQRPCSVCKFGL